MPAIPRLQPSSNLFKDLRSPPHSNCVAMTNGDITAIYLNPNDQTAQSSGKYRSFSPSSKYHILGTLKGARCSLLYTLAGNLLGRVNMIVSGFVNVVRGRLGYRGR